MLPRVAAAALLIPLILGTLFYAPLWVFLVVVEVFLSAALWEFHRLLAAFGAEKLVIAYPALTLLPVIWAYRPEWILEYFILSAWLIFIWSLIQVVDLSRGLLSASGNLMALVYLGFPFSIVTEYHPSQSPSHDPHKTYELVLVLIAVWAADSGAYFVGRTWGKRKIIPRLSPGKSLEGFIAAVVSAILAVWVCQTYFQILLPARGWLLVGLALGFATISGDLFESFLKRGAKMKDTSSLIPGHGGVLDRIDSLLFALPAYYLLTSLLK